MLERNALTGELPPQIASPATATTAYDRNLRYAATFTLNATRVMLRTKEYYVYGIELGVRKWH